MIDYSLVDRVAVLRMDDGKANALSMEMLDAIAGAVTRATKEASAIVLTGRPGRYCAGFDLKTMMSSPANAVTLLRRGGDVLMQLYGVPLPLVVACSGHALAGGALMTLVGDWRIGATGEFRIGLNEVSIGLPMPVLAMELARDRLKKAELPAATLMSKIYDPEAAVAAGYLDEVVSADALLERATAEAKRLGGLSGMAYAATKERLRRPTIDRIAGSFEADMKAFMP